MPSPKNNRAETISPKGRNDVLREPSSLKSPIRTSRTAGVVLPVQRSPALPPIPNSIMDSVAFGIVELPSLEIMEDSTTPAAEGTTLTLTTAGTTVAEYSRAQATWFKEDPLARSYAALAPDWVDLECCAWLLKDDKDGQWNPGSPLFDVEASFGAMGHHFGTGLYFRRPFSNKKLQKVHAPILFLRQFPDQEFAEFPMISGCLDDLLATAGLEIGAFTAWLSVIPVLPVPVNRTFLGKIKLREVPTEPGKKPSKAKKMMISLDLVAASGAQEEDEDEEEQVVYVRAEGLFVRPGEGGMDLRRFQMYGPMWDSEAVWGTEEVEDWAEAMIQERLVEAGQAGPGDLERAKAQRAEFMSLLKGEGVGAGILARAQNPQALEAQWVETHPIFTQIPELRCAPADPVPGGNYLEGLAMLCFSHYPSGRQAQLSGMQLGAQEGEGKCCVVGAVHFLPTVEGPCGLAHGGSIYGIFEHLFQQALKSTTTNRTRPAAVTRMSLDNGEERDPADQLVMKVQYKIGLPLNDTYRLECRICEEEPVGPAAGSGGGARSRRWILRGTLRSLDGETLHNSAEAVLPEGLLVAAPVGAQSRL